MSDIKQKKKYRSMHGGAADLPPVITMAQRETFTVIKYTLSCAQVKQAIELYLTEQGAHPSLDAQYNVNEQGAIVTSWFPEKAEVKDEARP